MNKFTTALSCIDGRVQAPIAEWLKLHTNSQYVNMITEPGIDLVLSSRESDKSEAIADKLRLSIEVHRINVVSIVGHYDCAANPASFDEHKLQIQQSVEIIRSWGIKIRILGLYVNEWSAIDVIYDSDSEFKEMKSYL